ncbi:hypothetical protein DV711_05920 [Motiliproteus coralliicola]|uniref:Uncharacterized protein n=1 Tax=Motiliproteus coralliicola TaxID=2283196 RepID=A0A369WVE6_9GAMM|nr:hypothetical protein [Motiliproteus coralliicola]RDE25093.1 hypothetical protein DV711_05920 [Motiliproteus coralliicola]
MINPAFQSLRLRFSALLLALVLPLAPLQADPLSEPESNQWQIDQAQALIAEVLNNIDWELLMRVQKNLLSNMDLLIPYTQEYLQCLEAEGLVHDDQPLSLELLMQQAGQASNRCKVIVQSLLGQLNFDISAEEFEQGLSPEYRDQYREMLEQSL